MDLYKFDFDFGKRTVKGINDKGFLTHRMSRGISILGK